MPVCTAGSEPQADAPRFVFLGESWFRSVLGAAYDWLRPFVPVLNGFPIDTDVLCASEPPNPGELDGSDLFNLGGTLRGNLFTLALTKLTDLVLERAWYEYCECTAEATPAAPAIQAEPADLPVFNPPGTVGPCLEVEDEVNVPGGPGTVWLFGNHAANLVNAQAMPAGATYLRITRTHVSGTGSSQVCTTVFGWTGPTTPVSLGTSNVCLNVGATSVINVPIAANTYFGFSADAIQGFDTNHVMRIKVQVWCGNLPDQLATPCCPPDPSLLTKLASIEAMVTLIQRQDVPFAYIGTTLHAGLTGTGTFAVQGILGLAIELTTLPGWTGYDEGTPDVLYDAGWVAVGTADGWGDPHRIRSQEHIWFPHVAGVVTAVGYTLPPGFVASIRELVRES